MRPSNTFQVVAPTLLPGSGGHRTILTNADELVVRGLDVSVHLEAVEGPPLDLPYQAELAESLVPGITSRLSLRPGWDGIDDRLPVMATAAPTAWVMAQNRSSHRFYFIQDRESRFINGGTRGLRAEHSYLIPATRIAIGRWIPHYLRREFGVAASSVPFGVDRSIYGPGLAAKSTRPRLAVLIQPEKPRRLTELVLDALEQLAARRPDVDIVLFGSDHPIRLSAPAKHLGLIPEASIAYLYNSAWAGVCLSATNPSRVPFEMARCGLPVIDILSYNTLFDYPRDMVGLVYPGPTSLAAAMEEALTTPEPLTPQGFSRSVFDMPTRQREAEDFATAVLGRLDGVVHPAATVDDPAEIRYDYQPHPTEAGLAENWLKALSTSFGRPAPAPLPLP